MTQSTPFPFTARLRSLMQAVGIASFKSLGQVAGVSEWQVQQLRQGKLNQMRVETLYRFSNALQVSLPVLIKEFSPLPEAITKDYVVTEPPAVPQECVGEGRNPGEEMVQLRREYDRLYAQLKTQRETLQHEFQHTTLQTLESLLLQLPTAIHAVQSKPDLPASRLLPLLSPIDRLLHTWNIEVIGPVGTETSFDPQQHQVMDGQVQVGDRVRIRYVGYRQGEHLLYRAKVSPV